jgi:Cu(I)/Ag(I) efflux system membrane fusion protein
MSLVGETLAGARERLKLLDLSDEQIAALDEHREPDRLTTFVSKTRGVVTRRQATAGLYVEPGRTLYELADLSTVWIQADVYEAELPLIHLENIVSLQLDSLPGETVAGRVDFIYPTLEEATRTARVRIEVENADGRLKPGMYATVSIAADLGEQLVIDNDAVLDTGTRQVVFVDLGHGRFEPREIKVGERAEGMAVVLEGVEAGERVVTSANFLVDSESRLKAALTQHSAAAHQGH